MCQRKSFVVDKSGRLSWLLDSDSHEDIAQSVGLMDKKVYGREMVRLECEPEGYPFSTDPKDWRVKVDEPDTLHAWFEDARQEWMDRCITEMVDVVIPKEKETGRVGSLVIKTEVDIPWLTSVGGNLYINSEATLTALTSVGGNLYIYSEATLTAPALTSVGGNLDIYSEATLTAPALTSVNGKPYKTT